MAEKPKLYTGTSGYSFKTWKGIFYPEDLPEKQMLPYYGSRFQTVEINYTFHHMPSVTLFESWKEKVPPDFKFVLKAPRRITHTLRLKNTADPLSFFLKTAETLQNRLGPVLFQLPPSLKKDGECLRDFISLLPPRILTAFEFRHPSWFDDDIFGLLQDHGCALCIADAEEDLEVPFAATADWGYLRLRRPGYSDADLVFWAERIKKQPWHSVYVFFKHEVEGPHMALHFTEIF